MQIHRDASKGDREAITRALDAGVSVDITDTHGFTPLMWSVSSSHSNSQTVQLLLERGANPNAVGGEPARPVLGHALMLNEPERVQLLLDAGADAAVSDANGFNALIWAVYGSKTHMLEVVELLLDHGAPTWGESDYGESALSVSSNRGRFDVVKRLLDSGAHETLLGWTPLLRAIALGSLEDVEIQLKRGAALSQRDDWERTPWLLALATGDLEKAKLLLAAGANRDDVGRCGKTALMYAIENNHLGVLKWLIEEKFYLEATNEFGKTALMEAASWNASECVRLLLEAGADADKTDQIGLKAIAQTSSRDIVRLLVAHGQDLNDLEPENRAALLGLEYGEEPETSREEFVAGRQPRFGTANPEKMDVPFWDAMVRSGASAYTARNLFVTADKIFDDAGGPVWCYQRYGKSITLLPDGRLIEIGGSHEDWDDPDFGVYNEVFVHHPHGQFDIFGYPLEVFCPTDFHSATFANGFIYIIGCMGYQDRRVIGHTSVYRLNVETLAIEQIETSGKAPGCISMHKGTLVDNEIHVCGGECIEVFILNLDTHEWRREVN
ncbi:hypothetical protein IAD21_04930 [Abditibacteriota bacterium]|nr:hypothetical protein IAD21_04930 [Abditibacteriota bacterium]